MRLRPAVSMAAMMFLVASCLANLSQGGLEGLQRDLGSPSIQSRLVAIEQLARIGSYEAWNLLLRSQSDTPEEARAIVRELEHLPKSTKVLQDHPGFKAQQKRLLDLAAVLEALSEQLSQGHGTKALHLELLQTIDQLKNERDNSLQREFERRIVGKLKSFCLGSDPLLAQAAFRILANRAEEPEFESRCCVDTSLEAMSSDALYEIGEQVPDLLVKEAAIEGTRAGRWAIRVLVVEDHPALRQILISQMKSRNPSVRAFARQAIKHLASNERLPVLAQT